MSADTMPPLPAHPWRTAPAGWEWEEIKAVHAYARTYAAEQVRELVEALELARDFLREWQEDFPESVGAKEPAAMLRFRALIAKHKGQA